jgi:NCS1 family nucleobase:cation symporter-1
MIMICDFYIVKRGNVDIPALYNPHGRYRYNRFGTNWRALVTLLIVVPPNLPGLVRVITKGALPLAIGNQRCVFPLLFSLSLLSSSSSSC